MCGHYPLGLDKAGRPNHDVRVRETRERQQISDSTTHCHRIVKLEVQVASNENVYVTTLPW